MIDVLPWPAIGSFFAGVVAVWFLAYLWSYQGETGARLFMGVIGCVALWTLSYGAALLVFEPTARVLFEIPIWLGINFSGVFFLAFALEYTGRKRAVRSRLMALVVVYQLGATALVATNPAHGLVWSEYRIEPVAGVAGVAVTNEALLYVILLGTMLLTTIGIAVLVDAFASYGPLYRRQTIALALSPVPILLGILPWALQIGPVPQLNLAPLLFPVHLGLDMYAFFRRNMFELTPAARRAGDRTAIDDLGVGVVIVDDERRIINLNEAAAEILDSSKDDVLGRSLDVVWPEIDLTRADQRITQPTARQPREYAVSVSTLTDSGGSPVGHTVTFQDITAERQREQRLAVLNRILRHNLRNDLNVASGYLDLVDERVDEAELTEMLDVAARNVEDVLDLGEKARTVERTLEADELGTEPVPVGELVDGLAAELIADYGGTVDNRVPDDLRVETNPQLLESVFRNLIENGLEHSDQNKPAVTVDAVVDRQRARFDIRDNGPGIPQHELDVIDEGEETALEHGSGIGLWLVEWGATALGGDVRFETGPEGTTATFRLPNVVGSAPDDEAAPEVEPAA
ncbi:MAG: histidine kinase N-terminal 7TM domain-containing protein [Halohasta sp.]